LQSETGFQGTISPEHGFKPICTGRIEEFGKFAPEKGKKGEFGRKSEKIFSRISNIAYIFFG
jgi:hypothetical protein